MMLTIDGDGHLGRSAAEALEGPGQPGENQAKADCGHGKIGAASSSGLEVDGYGSLLPNH